MALPTYSTGTASVAAGGTVVTGVGGMWSGINAKQGDWISINNVATVLITEVTDATHLQISPWPGAAQSGVSYVIYQNYVGRVVGVAAAEDVGDMLEMLHVDGLPFIVGPDETVPDPSFGDDGQLAFKPETGEWWEKIGGIWAPMAAPGGGSFLQAGTGATARTMQDKAREIVSVQDYGAIGDGTADDTAAIAAAWAACLAMPVLPELVFPEGIYKASVFPNFALSNAKVTSRGKVTLRYTGSGNAVVLDTGGTTTTGPGAYYMTFGRFHIEAPTGLTPFRINGVHHSWIDVDVRSVNAGQVCALTEFCVCSEFKIHISGPTGTPSIGLVIGSGDSGKPTCWCTFYNTIIEGLPTGIQFENAMGNLLIGGTAENGGQGVLIDTPAFNNRLIGMDFEANTAGDVTIHGVNNCLIDCDTGVGSGAGYLTIAGTYCEVRGGTHKTIINNGTRTRLSDFTFNKNNDGGLLTDNASTTSLRNNLTNGGASTALDSFTVWQSFTPVLVQGGGTLPTYTASGAYLVIGKTVFVTATIVITAGGLGATGFLYINNMPKAAKRDVVLYGRNSDGPMLQANMSAAGGTNLVIVKYDGNYPMISAASSLFVSGIYEST